MTTEEFHVARYNGVLAVMKSEREKYRILEKSYKRLQSEFNVLKRVHLDLVADCIKQKHKLREKIKCLKK